MKVALVGQPNCGKSTLFNALAGYRSLTSNFAGTTVEFTHGQARVGAEVLDLIDLPGLYSLTPTSSVEKVSRDYLLGGDWDVIVNVLDASQIARSLELTLELLDLESPMVVCLNMMDEAARKGMTIDRAHLETALGVPVVEAIGVRGRGVLETFRAAQDAVASGHRPSAFVYAPEAESVLEELAEKIAPSNHGNVLVDRPSGSDPSTARAFFLWPRRKALVGVITRAARPHARRTNRCAKRARASLWPWRNLPRLRPPFSRRCDFAPCNPCKVIRPTRPRSSHRRPPTADLSHRPRGLRWWRGRGGKSLCAPDSLPMRQFPRPGMRPA